MAEQTTTQTNSAGDAGAKAPPPAGTVLGGMSTNSTEGKAEGTKAPAADGGKVDPPKKQEEQTAEKTDGKTEDGKGAEGKPADAPKPIEVKVPDGITADKALVEGFTKLATEKGMTSAQAQSVFDLYVSEQKQAEAKFVEQVKKWDADFTKDKELGGSKLEATRAAQKAAMVKFGTPELARALDESGLGNHPDVQRFFAKVGKGLAEDSSDPSDNAVPVNTQNPEEERLAKLYPSMKKPNHNEQE